MHGETLTTYNEAAPKLAEYFEGIGPRTEYIEEALMLAGQPLGEADVLELGCGDGRDAAHILPRVKSYVGLDYSEGLLRIAKNRLPDADFRQIDMARAEYPAEAFDVVIAFASILHLDIDEVTNLFSNVANTLRQDGIFYISTKHADIYTKELKHDEFGTRLFYFYSPELLAYMAGEQFEVVKAVIEMKGSTAWTEMALRKK